jgi:hypothetical protein
MNIYTNDSRSLDLESLRPKVTPAWQLVASGYWSEDIFHSGHIAYYIGNVGPGQWLLDGVERKAVLDDVTEEDVAEGRLNDDQIQAMWGYSLEEAKALEYRSIRAACSNASDHLSAREVAAILYRAACDAGSSEITEPDANAGLIEL